MKKLWILLLLPIVAFSEIEGRNDIYNSEELRGYVPPVSLGLNSQNIITILYSNTETYLAVADTLYNLFGVNYQDFVYAISSYTRDPNNYCSIPNNSIKGFYDTEDLVERYFMYFSLIGRDDVLQKDKISYFNCMFNDQAVFSMIVYYRNNGKKTNSLIMHEFEKNKKLRSLNKKSQ